MYLCPQSLKFVRILVTECLSSHISTISCKKMSQITGNVRLDLHRKLDNFLQECWANWTCQPLCKILKHTCYPQRQLLYRLSWLLILRACPVNIGLSVYTSGLTARTNALLCLTSTSLHLQPWKRKYGNEKLLHRKLISQCINMELI